MCVNDDRLARLLLRQYSNVREFSPWLSRSACTNRDKSFDESRDPSYIWYGSCFFISFSPPVAIVVQPQVSYVAVDLVVLLPPLLSYGPVSIDLAILFLVGTYRRPSGFSIFYNVYTKRNKPNTLCWCASRV